MSASVLVVGGGIAGLAAAYDLMQAGLGVTLVDPADRLGGKVRTEQVDGFLVEAGPDSFVSYRPAARTLAAEVGLAEELLSPTEPREVYLRHQGEMIPLPDGMGMVLPTRLGPFARTRLLSWPEKLRAGLDVAMPRRLGTADVSVGAFLRERLGEAVVTQLADPLLGGIYGAPVDELSMDAVLPQLRTYEREHRSLILASLAAGRSASAPAPSPFLSLRRGMGSLAEAVAAQVTASDLVDLPQQVSVTGLERAGTTSVARLSDGSTLRADAVVIAAPTAETAALLSPEIPQAATLLGGVRLASTGVVTLGYPEDAFPGGLPGHGFLEAGPRRAATSGCTVASAKWQGRAPDGTVLLRMFLPDRSAALLQCPDDAVYRVVEAEVAQALGMAEPSPLPLIRHLQRWVHAMPVYAVGHLDRMARLTSVMQRRPEWVLAGSTYGSGGVPGAIASGRLAAARVLAAVS